MTCILALPAALASTTMQSAAAQTPTPVEIRFELTDPKFRNRFGPQAPDFETRAAALIAEQLATRIGFVRFVVDRAAEHKLVFLLDRRERTSSGPFEERGLWARLILPDETRSEIYWLPVRLAEHSHLPVGSATELLNEFQLLLQHADLESLKTDLLTQVPIATHALVSRDPLGWALPFSHRDLCIKNQSRLRIVNEVRSGNQPFERLYLANVIGSFRPSSSAPELQPFQQRIFTEPERADQDALRSAFNGGQIKVLGVYVMQYLHDQSACRSEPIPPVTDGSGGGA